MKKAKTCVIDVIIIGLIVITMVSCGSEDWTEHQNFMNESDCFVYTREVINESLNDYRVEYIDKDKASGCVKSQLSNTYLFYISEDYYVAVSPSHPKGTHSLITFFVKKYNRKQYQLSKFFIEKNNITLTLSKKYFNPSDTLFHNQYFDYEYVFLSKDDNMWNIDSTKYVSQLPWEIDN